MLISFSSASVANDLAIELVESNEKEFIESSSFFKAELKGKGPNYLYSGFALYKSLCEFHKAELMDRSSFKMYEIAETFCFPTFWCLRDYLSDLQPYQMTIIRNKNAQDMVPGRDRDGLSSQKKILEDRDLLWGEYQHY
jgi:hypothetical protein